jgi:hypothetical protein
LLKLLRCGRSEAHHASQRFDFWFPLLKAEFPAPRRNWQCRHAPFIEFSARRA